MGDVILMPFSGLPREEVLARAVKLVSEQPRRLVEFAAIDGDVRVVVDNLELWFTPEECAELLEMWSEAVADAADQRRQRGY